MWQFKPDRWRQCDSTHTRETRMCAYATGMVSDRSWKFIIQHQGHAPQYLAKIHESHTFPPNWPETRQNSRGCPHSRDLRYHKNITRLADSITRMTRLSRCNHKNKVHDGTLPCRPTGLCCKPPLSQTQICEFCQSLDHWTDLQSKNQNLRYTVHCFKCWNCVSASMYYDIEFRSPPAKDTKWIVLKDHLNHSHSRFVPYIQLFSRHTLQTNLLRFTGRGRKPGKYHKPYTNDAQAWHFKDGAHATSCCFNCTTFMDQRRRARTSTTPSLRSAVASFWQNKRSYLFDTLLKVKW